MMILMHDSERYGYLATNGSPIPPGFVSRKCGCDTLGQYETLLAELDSVGVPRRTSDGIIYCKRMVDDAKRREDAAERQRRSRGRHGHVTEPVTPAPEVEDEDEISEKPEIPMPNVLLTEAFKSKWEEYVVYRSERRLSVLKPKSVKLQWDALAEYGHEGAIESINQSIRNQWQGLFPPKGSPAARPLPGKPTAAPANLRDGN